VELKSRKIRDKIMEKRRSTVLNSDVIEPKLGGKTLIYE
jgi:hypothetical protein